MGRPALPRDANHNTIQLTPNTPALARSVNASLASSTQLSFNAATTMLRVYALVQDVYLKWGTTAATNANFDEVIPAGQVVDLIVPDTYTGATIIERVASATAIVIEK